MQKAIALEHPELSCVGIDLDLNFSDNEAESIFQEICTTEIEQVAYRNNQRYVARLVRPDMSTCSQVGKIDQNQIKQELSPSDMSTCSQVDKIDQNKINQKLSPSDMSTCSHLDKIDQNKIKRH